MFEIRRKTAQKPKIALVDIELSNNQMTIRFSGILKFIFSNFRGH